MRFPLVHRARLDASEREVEFLTREVNFWRERFNSEKERADRGVDSALASIGREPISEPVRAENKKVADSILDWQKQVGEIFGDVAESVLAEGEKDPNAIEGATVVYPISSEERETRLAAIRASNVERFQRVNSEEATN